MDAIAIVWTYLRSLDEVDCIVFQVMIWPKCEYWIVSKFCNTDTDAQDVKTSQKKLKKCQTLGQKPPSQHVFFFFVQYTPLAPKNSTMQ